MTGPKPKNVDPLFQLFEHHLLTRSYDDSAAFAKEVATEYLSYLDSTIAHVPLHLRQGVLEDLEQETHEMLVKKMYGCVRMTDYLNYGKVSRIDSNREIRSFEFTTPPATEEKNPPPEKD